MQKVIFVDRDGVINKNPPKSDYVKSWKEFKFLPGAIEGLKLLSDNNYQIIVVTNQAGIARKMMGEADLTKIHKNMQDELKEHGVKLKAIYYCPHHWNDGCNCRKPKPGMFLKAVEDYNFNITKAIFIGDKSSDKEVAQVTGCKFIQMLPDGNLFKAIRHLVLTKSQSDIISRI